MKTLFDGYMSLLPKKKPIDGLVFFGATWLGGVIALALGQLAGLPQEAPTLYFTPFFILAFPLSYIFISWWSLILMGMLYVSEWPFRATWKAVAKAF
jgi:hypothetical protein